MIDQSDDGPQSTAAPLIVALPVFDDWMSLSPLLQDLDRVLLAQHVVADILVIDDGSTIPAAAAVTTPPMQSARRVEILHLRRNVGHQRAIAIGLAFIHDQRPCDAVLVMDADGEDRPADVPALLARFHELGGSRIVFAARTKRAESIVFRAGYSLYRMVHRALTGLSVRVGNFSVIPFRSLGMLVVVSELWNHYAASVVKARLPFDDVPTTRGRRLAGEAAMNYTALVIHGMSALSIYADVIGVRVLAATATLAIAGTLTMLALFAGGGAEPAALMLPTAVIAGGALFLTAGLAIVLLLLALAARSSQTFIPLRDYKYFVDRVTVADSRDVRAQAHVRT